MTKVQKIELTVRAAQVAAAALDMLGTSDVTLAVMQYRRTVDELAGLAEMLDKWGREEKAGRG